MLGVLTGFIDELRAAGVPVSTVEAIDAAGALKVVDWSDREAVRSALGATLVKNARHYETFETLFEVFFGLRAPVGVPAAIPSGWSPGGEPARGGGGDGDPDAEALALALFTAIRDENLSLLRAVVLAAVDRLAGMEPGRPVGGTYYLYRTLRHLDVDGLAERVLAALEAQADLTPLERRLAREEVELRVEEFRRQLRTEIRRRLVADRGVQAVARTLRRPVVEDVDLLHAGREELAEIERIVHPLTRKLAARLAQRRKRGRRGRLDMRSTIRRSLGSGGVPVEPRFRSKGPTRPEIFLLCDISGSVATFARFTMQLVYAMAHEFTRIRAFAFIDALDEVTEYFGPGIDFAGALARLSTEAEVVWLDGHSDYGNALRLFVDRYADDLTPRSTVIITGDARNNYHDPDPGALADIARAARAVFWLNPEAVRYWDTGDSVMAAYAPLCDGVYEVRNLRQLADFVERVTLPAARRVRPWA